MPDSEFVSLPEDLDAPVQAPIPDEAPSDTGPLLPPANSTFNMDNAYEGEIPNDGDGHIMPSGANESTGFGGRP